MDLFALPDELKGKFDFVLEVYTIQALPLDLRDQAIKAIAELVAPDGELLYVGRGADEGETTENPPFPIRKSELDKFVAAGLKEKERANHTEMTEEEFAKHWRYHRPEIMHAGAAEAVQAYKMRDK